MKMAEAEVLFKQGKLITIAEYRSWAKREVTYTKAGQSGKFTVIEHRVEVEGQPFQFEEPVPKGVNPDTVHAPAQRGERVVLLLKLEPQQPRGFRVSASVQPLEK